MGKFKLNPFATDNTLLAFALRNAGVPWADSNSPCWNVYQPDALKKFGLSSIDEAVQRGIPGKVTYFLERVEKLDELLKAFDTQSAVTDEIQSGKDVPASIDIAPEDMMRVVAHVLKGYNDFKGLWKRVPPKLMIPNPGKTRKKTLSDGRVRYSSPGARIVGAKASQETLTHLKIK